MKKKEAAHPWLDGETGNAAAMDTEDDITALILTVNRVERELEANTPLKEFIVTRAREHVERGTRFGMQCLVEEMRWRPRADIKGRDMTLNNNDAAIVTRLLIEQMPEVAPYVERRHSKYDRVFELRANHAAC